MNAEFKCGGKIFSKDHPLIIAEIGTAHAGDIGRAVKMIDSIASSGCDAVKFQIVYANEILHPKSGYVKLPSGNVLLYDKFKELEQPVSFYAKLKEHADKKGLLFSASVFGKKSLDDLVSLEPDFFKIASPELNYHSLIKEVSLFNLPLILSTGVSRLSDIESALEASRSVNKENEIAILHCITSYPAPESEYNISLIENLSNIFDIPVGLSDHSIHSFFVPLLSLAFGSCIIEKHLCLSKSEDGLDDKIALEPDEFSKMCGVLRSMEGKGKEEIIEFLKNEGITQTSIEKVIGNGVKRLAQSEAKNYERTNRSIHYVHSMKKGMKIQEADITIVRTEKELSVGLSPQFYDVVVGSVLQRDVNEGAGVCFADIINKDIL